MKTKLVGILLCMLLIASTALPMAYTINIEEDEISITPCVTGDSKIVGESIIEEISDITYNSGAPIWQWAKSAGKDQNDVGCSICVDNSGNSYVTGWFHGTVTFGSDTLNTFGYDDIFVAKLDTYGNWLWAVNAGGSTTGYGYDAGTGIDIDSNGDIYVTGYFRGTASFFGSTITLTSVSDSVDVFVAKLNTNGIWQWAKSGGGINEDKSLGISVDSTGNPYITGCFQGDATFDSDTLHSDSGSYDVFVAKLNTNGIWQWAKSGGGSDFDVGNDIAVDSAGNPCITGMFEVEATFGYNTLYSFGGRDVFVAKLDTYGNWLWAVNGGGSSEDHGYGICVDPSGNSYVTGSFQLQATFGGYTPPYFGSADIFVTKLDAGGAWLWAKSAGGNGGEVGWGICVDANGNTYITGYFNSNPANFDSIPLSNSGLSDVYVAKLNPSGTWLWAVSAGGTSYDMAEDICIDPSRNLYITGEFMALATFYPYDINSNGESDIFVAKLSQCAGDTTPPVTTHSFDPATPTGVNNWYSTPVTVTLDATDASGLAKTSYSLDGGLNWIDYTGPIWPFSFPISGCVKPGDFKYKSEDLCGNIESEVTVPNFKVDTIPPFKWFFSIGSIHILITKDCCSGLERIEWLINGVLWLIDMISPPGTNGWRIKIRFVPGPGTVTTIVYDMAGNWA